MLEMANSEERDLNVWQLLFRQANEWFAVKGITQPPVSKLSFPEVSFDLRNIVSWPFSGRGCEGNWSALEIIDEEYLHGTQKIVSTPDATHMHPICSDYHSCPLHGHKLPPLVDGQHHVMFHVQLAAPSVLTNPRAATSYPPSLPGSEMRLLNTHTVQLSEFHGVDIPHYAILSHTWEREEVLYADMQNGHANERKEYNKVRGCCQLAADKGFSWVWIDTCCIDKSSSSELSEAINSMYRWYARAAICIVYLQDIDIDMKSIGSSRWFKRGWTLQELIAPAHAEFYSSSWKDIGTKTSLARQLSHTTGIPIDVLQGGRHPSTCSVAQRMSWASDRVTTREEDEAYCLLGLFEVNMPLLYGEGKVSFIRLQEQILRQQEDYSIFAWTSREYQIYQPWLNEHDEGDEDRGFLASSPAHFSRLYNRGQPAFDTEALRCYPSLFQLNSIGSSFGEYLEHGISEHASQFATTALQRSANNPAFTAWRLAPDYIKHQGFDIIPTEKISQQPPEVTGRGIRVTLPVLVTPALGFHLLAWFYCEMFDRLLCVPLQESVANSSGLFSRKDPSILVSVDKHYLRDFKLKQLYLCVRDQSRVAVPASINFESKSSPEYLVCLVENGSWTMVAQHRWYPPVDLRNRSQNIVLLGIYCSSSTSRRTMGPCPHPIQVFCGLGSRHAWCIMEECKDSNDQKAALHRRAQYLLGQDTSFFENLPDRVTKMTTLVQGMVMGAAMRKKFSSIYKHGEYTLEFGVWNLSSCPLWVKHGLN